MSKKRLGRGLDALLAPGKTQVPDRRSPEEPPAPAGGTAASQSADAATTAPAAPDGLPIDLIYRSPYQPRREFKEEALAELADSIRAQGLMQPVVVRPRAAGGYELIAGERRWRAAQLAGMTRLPAVIRDVDDRQAAAMALIENIQREDLNPLEEAQALQRLREEFELTHEQIANAVGKSRVAVTNLMRLLNLAPAVRSLLDQGLIEMGHARALLSLEPQDQEKLAQEVAQRGLTVRQTEQRVRNLGKAQTVEPVDKDPDTRRLENDLSDRLGAPVQITYNAKGKGQLVIRYSNMDQLEGILNHLR